MDNFNPVFGKNIMSRVNLISESVYALKAINAVLSTDITNRGIKEDHLNDYVIGGIVTAANIIACNIGNLSIEIDDLCRDTSPN